MSHLVHNALSNLKLFITFTAIHTKDYVLVGADLTDLVSTEPLLRSVMEDVTAPTLIISEVVLAYLSPEKSVTHS